MRRRVGIAILMWVALWPLAHRALVAAYDINPWKLGGWAMYTTVRPPVLVVLFTKNGDAFVPVARAGLSRSTRDALTTFQAERHALGKLRQPRDVARRVLEDRRELSSIVIVVQTPTLDRRTARITARRDVYEYDRAASLR